jgi:hypothetical protein
MIDLLHFVLEGLAVRYPFAPDNVCLCLNKKNVPSANCHNVMLLFVFNSFLLLNIAPHENLDIKCATQQLL